MHLPKEPNWMELPFLKIVQSATLTWTKPTLCTVFQLEMTRYLPCALILYCGIIGLRTFFSRLLLPRLLFPKLKGHLFPRCLLFPRFWFLRFFSKLKGHEFLENFCPPDFCSRQFILKAKRTCVPLGLLLPRLSFPGTWSQNQMNMLSLDGFCSPALNYYIFVAQWAPNTFLFRKYFKLVQFKDMYI